MPGEAQRSIELVEKRFAHRVRVLKPDNGSEFSIIEPFLKQRGIGREFSARHQKHDGASFADIQKSARTIIGAADLYTAFLWRYALQISITITWPIKVSSIFVLWPHFSKFRVFGAFGYFKLDHNQKPKIKQKVKNRLVLFIGLDEASKSFWYKTIWVHDAKFDEIAAIYQFMKKILKK